MTTKPKNEFVAFIDVMIDELIAMPDDQVLEGLDPEAVKADGLRIFNSAKAEVGRARLAAAKTGVANLKGEYSEKPMLVSVEEARKFIANASNDKNYTLAARELSGLSDDEVLRLYRKFKQLESKSTEADE